MKLPITTYAIVTSYWNLTKYKQVLCIITILVYTHVYTHEYIISAQGFTCFHFTVSIHNFSNYMYVSLEIMVNFHFFGMTSKFTDQNLHKNLQSFARSSACRFQFHVLPITALYRYYKNNKWNSDDIKHIHLVGTNYSVTIQCICWALKSFECEWNIFPHIIHIKYNVISQMTMISKGCQNKLKAGEDTNKFH